MHTAASKHFLYKTPHLHAERIVYNIRIGRFETRTSPASAMSTDKQPSAAAQLNAPNTLTPLERSKTKRGSLISQIHDETMDNSSARKKKKLTHATKSSGAQPPSDGHPSVALAQAVSCSKTMDASSPLVSVNPKNKLVDEPPISSPPTLAGGTDSPFAAMGITSPFLCATDTPTATATVLHNLPAEKKTRYVVNTVTTVTIDEETLATDYARLINWWNLVRDISQTEAEESLDLACFDADLEKFIKHGLDLMFAVVGLCHKLTQENRPPDEINATIEAARPCLPIKVMVSDYRAPPSPKKETAALPDESPILVNTAVWRHTVARRPCRLCSCSYEELNYGDLRCPGPAIISARVRQQLGEITDKVIEQFPGIPAIKDWAKSFEIPDFTCPMRHGEAPISASGLTTEKIDKALQELIDMKPKHK